MRYEKTGATRLEMLVPRPANVDKDAYTMTALSPRETTDPFTEARLSRPAGTGFNLLPAPDQRPAASTRAPFGAVGRGIAAVVASVGEYLRRQRVVSELTRLSDRELADVGLTRADISQIFEPGFAARRNAERLG